MLVTQFLKKGKEKKITCIDKRRNGFSQLQLTPGNSNLQGTGENSSTYRMFELCEAPVKSNLDKNEILVRVKAIFSSDYINFTNVTINSKLPVTRTSKGPEKIVRLIECSSIQVF